jgi:serine/threonine protein kinase
MSEAQTSREIMQSHLPIFDKLTRPSVSNRQSVSIVGAFVGGGAFGRVFKARLRTGRPVALKRLPLAYGQKSDTREREMLDYIASHGVHNNIVRYFGGYGSSTSWGTTEECLVMELMPTDLDSCVGALPTQADKILSFAEAMVVMHGVASGLAHLHAIGVTHRDLKPQNILIDRRCRTGRLCL